MPLISSHAIPLRSFSLVLRNAIPPSIAPSKVPLRFGIIDFYLKYCHQYAFLGYEQQDLQLLDVGKLDTLEQAENFLK